MTLLAVIAGSIAALWLAQRVFVWRVARDWWRGPVTDHFNGARFRNLGPPPQFHGRRDMLRWKMTSKAAVWPKSLPVTPVVPAARIDGDALVVTMVGHVTVLIQTQGLNILTDPVWSDRASPFQWAGPRRVRAPGVTFDALPRIDVVLLSHNHYDHLDLATLRRLWARDRPRIITPIGNAALLARHGITASEGDWGDDFDLGTGARGHIAKVHIERVQHWSSRWGFDSYRALWCGFTIVLPGGSVYFSGDCGLDAAAFAAVRRHGPVRLALLGIGAYEPRWFMQYHHMNPSDAVAAFAELDPQRAIGMHWGVFQLTDEAIDAPPAALAAALVVAALDPSRFTAETAGAVIAVDQCARSVSTASSKALNFDRTPG
ncbi:MAG: MBL fold metallo-hydrolase [Polymorphobacter sp.]